MKLLGHGGILGVLVDSVTTNTVTCSDLVDTSSTPPNFVGRALSVIGRNGSSTPWLSATITAYTPSTGTVTVSPQAVVTGQPMQSIQAGDVLVVRMMADAENDSNQTQITDAGWINSQNKWLGLTPGTETGNILRVIKGTGRGQLRKLTGNTATGFQWDLPLYLDQTSVWIIEEPNWIYQADSPAIGNADYQHEAALAIAAANYANASYLVAGFTLQCDGTLAVQSDGAPRPKGCPRSNRALSARVL
jgi:hypothetical protein